MLGIQEFPRFPYCYTIASVGGVTAGFLDRGMGPFQRPSSALAAVCAGIAAMLAGVVCGKDRVSRTRLALSFLFFATLLAAAMSAYGLLDRNPSFMAIAALVAIATVPFAYVWGVLQWRAGHCNERDEKSARPWSGMAAYVLITLLLSWGPVMTFSGFHRHSGLSEELRLLFLSAGYALFMGWQPLVALYLVRRWIDPKIPAVHFRLPSGRYFLIAILAPFAIAVLAVGSSLLMGMAHPSSLLPPISEPRTFEQFNVAVAIFCAALSLLWIQALVEEVGWRGYFLESLMDHLGSVGGLVLHGLFWGAWYGPLFLVSSGVSESVGSSSLTFLVTCMLLGSLLGWMKLASGSLISPATANVLLTACAGLPLQLVGDDPGVRGAAYGPAGWIPMSLLLGAILVSGLRWPLNERNARLKPATTATHLLVLVTESSEQDEDAPSDKLQLH